MVITKIIINGFRGVRTELTLNTGESTNGRTPVLLLHGDNGTGKSSIVDAFEFCLQSRLHRRGGLSNPETPYSLALGVNSGFIKVDFEDGSSAERKIEINPKSGNIHATPSQPYEDYKIAPIVLRRSDILLFWDTPEHQRQTVFTDISLNSNATQAPEEFQNERLTEFEKERTKLKDERRRNADKLAHTLGISAAEINFATNELAKLIKEHVYGGMSQQQRQEARQRGVKVKNVSQEALGYAKRIEELSAPIMNLSGRIKNLSKNVGNPRLQAVKNLLKSAELELTTAFKEISTSSALIDKVEIKTGNIGSVDLSIVVNTIDGYQVNPKRIFSEANRDLLAFLVFLTIIHEAGRRGQNKILILDDVFQSVDAGIRLRIAEYVFKRFADWQVIITTHDRLWHQQLRLLVHRNGRQLIDQTVLRWEPSVGPIIIGATSDAEARLKKALHEGDTIGVCANGGLLLELLCQELTVNLATSVTRRPGDQYTLGDMWPSLSKALKRSSLKIQAENIDRWSSLRNLVGAHYNAWAQNVSLIEANGFGNAVLALIDATKCEFCSSFLSTSQKWMGLQCKCGKLVVTDYKS